MNKLDTLVYRSMLAYPMLFRSRWDVLRHLYFTIGNGYEWENGELVDVMSAEFDEQAARDNFFRDLDERRADLTKRREDDTQGIHRYHYDQEDANLSLDVEERKFLLENISKIALAKGRFRHSFNVYYLCQTTLIYEMINTIPDDVEESFKEGAIEALEMLIPVLHTIAEAGQDNGVRDKLIAIKKRLRPPPPREMIERILAQLSKPVE